MFKKHQKVTVGFVIQDFITLPNGTLVCQSQSFISGDDVSYEADGEAVEVDTSKEVYCPMDMVAPKQIPDPEDAVKFTCPECGDNRLEAVMDGSHTTIILGMFKSGSTEYGDTDSNGDLDRFQCVKCGHIITDDDGESITDDDELVEWCKENCEQDAPYIDPRYTDDNADKGGD